MHASHRPCTPGELVGLVSGACCSLVTPALPAQRPLLRCVWALAAPASPDCLHWVACHSIPLRSIPLRSAPLHSRKTSSSTLRCAAQVAAAGQAALRAANVELVELPPTPKQGAGAKAPSVPTSPRRAMSASVSSSLGGCSWRDGRCGGHWRAALFSGGGGQHKALGMPCHTVHRLIQRRCSNPAAPMLPPHRRGRLLCLLPPAPQLAGQVMAILQHDGWAAPADAAGRRLWRHPRGARRSERDLISQHLALSQPGPARHLHARVVRAAAGACRVGGCCGVCVLSRACFVDRAGVACSGSLSWKRCCSTRRQCSAVPCMARAREAV